MHSRGGFPVKNVLYAVFLLLMVYMVYIYNGSQNRLRDAELIGERYKREAEERVTEIQELVKSKDKFQELCQNEKFELNNRIKSINQQHSMLQSQYKETEADFLKLKQDMETVRQEHSMAESQHAQEFQKFKQDKEIEIAKLKDDNANLRRRNEELERNVATLQDQVKNAEIQQGNVKAEFGRLKAKILSFKAQLTKANTDFQKLTQSILSYQTQLLNANAYSQNLEAKVASYQKAQKTLVEENARLQQQNRQAPVNNVPQQQQFGKVEPFPGQGGNPNNFVQNMNIKEPAGNLGGQGGNVEGQGGNLGGQGGNVEGQGGNDFDNVAQGDNAHKPENLESFGRDADVAKPNLDELNSLNQVVPPNNKEEDLNLNKVKSKEEVGGAIDNADPNRGEVNPNDEQKVQIMEPVFDPIDKHKGGGEQGVDSMNARGAEEEREQGAKEEEEKLLEHKNPLSLGQLQVPGNVDVDDMQRKEGGLEDGIGNQNQQLPPLLNERNEQLEGRNNGENHYFEEDENADKMDEEEEQREEEEDMNANDRANEDENQDQFPADFGGLAGRERADPDYMN